MTVVSSTSNFRGELPLARDLAAGDAELVLELEFTPEFATVNFATEQLAVHGDGLFHLLRGFVEEFDSEFARAEGAHAGDVFRAGLRAGIEDGVAAADIGLERVFRADAVAEQNGMFVARAA